MDQNLTPKPLEGYPTWIYMVMGAVLGLIFVSLIGFLTAIIYIVLYGDGPGPANSNTYLVLTSIQVLFFLSGLYVGYTLWKRKFRF